MSAFQVKLYSDLMALCAKNEAFYFVDREYDGLTYRIFSYRLASYTDFLEPSALECRGHMFLISNGVELVSLPMEKFFNKDENPLTMGLDFVGPKQIMAKMDGSLISTYSHKGGLRLKSKTSLDSTMAIDAMDWLSMAKHYDFALTLQHLVRSNYTVNMEWISPNNRIVIGYPESKLVILNIRNNISGLYVDYKTIISIYPILKEYWVERVEVPNATEFVQGIYDMQGIEGYVIQLKSGQHVKVKTLAYVALHHTKDSVNSPRRLFECILNETADDLRTMFSDDEVALKLIAEMQEKVDKLYNHLVSRVEKFYETNKHLERKEYAILGQKELTNMEFGLAMSKYCDKPVSYKTFMINKWKEFGIKDAEPTQAPE